MVGRGGATLENLSVGPVDLVHNVGKDEVLVHPVEAVLLQGLLPQRVPSEADLIAVKRTPETEFTKLFTEAKFTQVFTFFPYFSPPLLGDLVRCVTKL